MTDPAPFREVVDHLAEVVWVVDDDFDDLRYINPAYERLVGRPIERAGEGIVTPRSVHPEDREAFREWVETIRSDIAAGTAADEYESRLRVRRPDGDVRWLETVAVPIRDDDGAVRSVAGISTDLTERVERERVLEEQVERLDQFASMVSHDLRNPLSVAMGRLELYRETGDDAHLDDVGDALERIESLTADLTALAREGEPEADRERVSLAAVAEAAWDGVDTRSATLDVDDVTLTGDESQLRVLFENLFRNAVGHGGADVTVRVGPLDGGFYVEDTGGGVPESVREDVFEHGFTTGYAGTGTGLTIVSRVAAAHGLDASLAESAEGGARVEFRPA